MWAKKVKTYVDDDDQSKDRNVARGQHRRAGGAGLGWTSSGREKRGSARTAQRHPTSDTARPPCIRPEHKLSGHQTRQWQQIFISFQPEQEAKPAAKTPDAPYVVAPVIAKVGRVTSRKYGADYGARSREPGADPPPHPQYLGGDARGNEKEFRSDEISKGTGVIGADHTQ